MTILLLLVVKGLSGRDLNKSKQQECGKFLCLAGHTAGAGDRRCSCVVCYDGVQKGLLTVMQELMS